MPRKNKPLFIRRQKTLVRIIIENILYIEAMQDYCRIHLLGDKVITLHSNLTNAIKYLPKEDFVRVHRSYLVNIDMIITFSLEAGNNHINIASKHIPIGEKYKKDFLNKVIILNPNHGKSKIR